MITNIYLAYPHQPRALQGITHSATTLY